jgi:hypothetical protein
VKPFREMDFLKNSSQVELEIDTMGYNTNQKMHVLNQHKPVKYSINQLSAKLSDPTGLK